MANIKSTAGEPFSQAPKLSVFISYSRDDLEFVDRLQPALVARGIATSIDHEDIEKGEAWWTRIQQLISEADTVIFVLSPSSVQSPICLKELEFAERLNKRVLPIVAVDLNGQPAPAALASLNYIFFVRNPAARASGEFEGAVNQLAKALDIDIGWIREHTRINTLAQHWLRGNRNTDLLLVGKDLESATVWAETRPRGAPTLTRQQVEYLMASRFSSHRVINLFGLVGVLSVISGSLSIVALVKHGLKMGSFVAPIQLVLDYYEFAIHGLLGSWAEPILKGIIVLIQPFFGWHLSLDPGWKHIFVLMMLFFSSFSRQLLGASGRRSAVVMWASGTAMSLLFSVWMGLSPLPESNSAPFYVLLNALVPMAPMVTVGLFFVGGAIWYSMAQGRIEQKSWFKVFVKRPTVPPAVALLLAIVLVFSLWVGGVFGAFSSNVLILLPLLSLPRPLVVGIGFVAIAMFFVAWAALTSLFYAKHFGTAWIYEFRTHFWTSVALSMIVVMLGAALVLAINAGLGIYYGENGIRKADAYEQGTMLKANS